MTRGILAAIEFVEFFRKFSVHAHDAFGIDPETQRKLLITIVGLLVIYIIRRVVIDQAHKRTTDLKARYSWRKTATYLSFAIASIFVGRIWVTGSGESLFTFFGLVSAGFAIALKDPIANLAGWAFMLWRKPFSVGDRIEVAGKVGDVIDLRIFQFTLVEVGNWVDADQSTGRILHIPNGLVFTQIQANYGKGLMHIWNEIPVKITFESNWQKAKKLLTDIVYDKAENLTESAERELRQASKQYMIFYSKLTPIVYTNVRGHGVLLTMRYLCNPRKRRGSEQDIWEAVLQEFAKHDDIIFAYDTHRIITNAAEGLPGIPGPPDQVSHE